MTQPARPDRRIPARSVMLAWSGMALATGLILWGTLSPRVPPMGVDIPSSDKVMHVGAFAVWAFLLRLAWPRPVWVLVVIGALFGAGIEVIQPLAGRETEMADLLADIAGCAIGALLAVALRRLWVGRAGEGRG